MANPTEHALEHGEHATHAAHDPFDRRVTISISVTAALLACVTLLGHRAHSDTLQLSIQSNDALTEASNQWNYFQAKKTRQYLYETAATRTRMDIEHPALPKETAAEWTKKVQEDLKYWKDNAGRYRTEGEEIKTKAEELTEQSKHLRNQSTHIHHAGTWYDMAELCVEIALVLCSIAILTKKRNFWYAGLCGSGLGTCLALWGIAQQYILVAHH